VSADATASTPTWTQVDGTTLPNRMVTSVAVDPLDNRVAHVTFGGFATDNVWRTSDRGASWTSVGASLPALPIRAVAVHPTRAGRLYVGTDLGVFASEDGGVSWGVPHDGPANAPVYQLFWMNSRLVAVTHGRGLFIAATDGAPLVTSHPADRAISAGQTTTFTVAVTGTPSPTFQWQVAAPGTSTWSPVGNSAPYSGATTATLTVTAAAVSLDGARYRVVVSNADGTVNSTAATLLVAPPSYGSVGAQPQQLQFTITKSGSAIVASTQAQTVNVVFSGVVSPWTASGTEPWIQISGGGGSGSGAMTITIVNPGDVIGSQTNLSGTVVVNAPLSSNGSVLIPISLHVTAGSLAPFGQVDTPSQDAQGVVGAIGVTGWALDDVGVTSVRVYRTCLAFEDVLGGDCQTILTGTPEAARVVYVGDAAFLAGARPDVEGAFSSFPQAHRAGWGMLLLTPMLPHVPSGVSYGGQGALTVYVVATDVEGQSVLLGRSSDPASPSVRTPTAITMANDTIAKPFGSIDTPALGQTISGVVANFGWSLTPDSNTTGGEGGDVVIPVNGSTMTVFVDAFPVAQVAYNQCRGTVGSPVAGGVYCNDDVSNIFGNGTPQPALQLRTNNPTRFRNLDAGRSPIGAFVLDTTTLSNGLHTIAWSVTDSLGRTEGIGSRFFSVLNAGADEDATLEAQDATLRARPAEVRGPAWALGGLPSGADGVWARTGFDLTQSWSELPQDADGRRVIEIGTGDRMELWLGATTERGFLVANGSLRDLPPGSSVRGPQFAWVPPAGYVGEYLLSFVRGGERIDVTVRVLSRH
jgi:hypothetical protein